MKKAYNDCLEIQRHFEHEIGLIKVQQPNPLPAIEKGMYITRRFTSTLREHVNNGCITNIEDEVYFFKFVKPQIVGYFLYYFYLQKIESSRPKGPSDNIKAYLKIKAEKCNNFLSINKKCYHHFQRHDIKHDQQCFIRCNIDPKDYNYHPYSMLDSEFATSKDYLFADFKAHEMLITYLCHEMDALDNPNKPNHSNLKWTGAKIDLTELIYALASSKVIDNGNADIKDISKQLCRLLNIDELDIYRNFTDLKNRKKNQTAFLDRLKDVLTNRMKDDFG